eukprot:2897278-Karenia_brevis.AAC.1
MAEGSSPATTLISIQTNGNPGISHCPELRKHMDIDHDVADSHECDSETEPSDDAVAHGKLPFAIRRRRS